MSGAADEANTVSGLQPVKTRILLVLVSLVASVLIGALIMASLLNGMTLMAVSP